MPETIIEDVVLWENDAAPVAEAATIKANVRRLSRELASLLANKTLPEALRKQVETFSSSLKKTWAELEKEAGQEQGHRGVAGAKESDIEEGDYYGDYVPSSVITFTQLDQANAAREVAENMRERVGQFQSMLNNIFFWSDAPDKIAAAQTLFDEFVQVVGDVLTGQDEDASVMGGEAESFTESFAPAIALVEAEGDAVTNPRGPLEMDVQIIRPGWGNNRDNHYYPADMLRRDAKVFEGAKMYATDHVQSEKNVRSEVSQIKRIVGFTEQGAPIARVVVFDPDFAEAARNRAKAGMLESLECSILADGKARPGFERDGRKGKVVESIVAVASVDWVTRAGAGGKALALAESDAQTEETVPATEAEPTAEVTIREEDQTAVQVEQPESGEETPPAADADQVEAPAPVEEPPAPDPVLGEAEVRAVLSKTRLPAESLLTLAFNRWENEAALSAAVAAEVRRLKEISGSGRPFGLGESAAAPDSTRPVSRSQIEETMDKINTRFGIGR
jgi:hypothetical protein